MMLFPGGVTEHQAPLSYNTPTDFSSLYRNIYTVLQHEQENVVFTRHATIQNLPTSWSLV
jgi:hypothetical protein